MMFKYLPLVILASTILNGEEVNEGAEKYPSPPAISYTIPGIIGKGGGGWIGSDHLLNLTQDIPVIVEIIKPDDLEIAFTADELREKVLNEFYKEGYDINFTPDDTKPPLPYFDILIMLQKIEGGYVASIEGRLFESVTLKRVILPDEVAFQAITWEKQNLIITPTDQLTEQVTKSTTDIAKIFLSRSKFFERQKEKLQKKVN